jgi:hypothetical protein
MRSVADGRSGQVGRRAPAEWWALVTQLARDVLLTQLARDVLLTQLARDVLLCPDLP